MKQARVDGKSIAPSRTGDAVEAEYRACRARDGLIAWAAHEIKNPLSAMLLQAQMLKRQLQQQQAGAEVAAGRGGMPVAAPRPVEWPHYLDIFCRQVLRLAGVVDQLLDCSLLLGHRFTLQLAHGDLMDMVVAVVQGVQENLQLAPGELVLQTRGCGPCVGVWDRRRLQAALQLLVMQVVERSAGQRVVLCLEGAASGVCLLIQSQRSCRSRGSMSATCRTPVTPAPPPQVAVPFDGDVDSLENFLSTGAIHYAEVSWWWARQVIVAHGGEAQWQTDKGAATGAIHLFLPVAAIAPP